MPEYGLKLESALTPCTLEIIEDQNAEIYNPEKVKQDWPEANLMIAEQTFCWLGRFKKILAWEKLIFTLYFTESSKRGTLTKNIVILRADILFCLPQK